MNTIIESIKRHKKIAIILLVIILIMLMLAIICALSADNEKSKEPEMVANTNEGIIKEEDYNGLVFNNVSLITEKG